MKVSKTHFEQIPTATVKKMANLETEEDSSGLAVEKSKPKSESNVVDMQTTLNARLAPASNDPKKQTAEARHKERVYQRVLARLERADARRKIIEKFR
jgi:hypothetical protein